jgi:hypothetical protein
MRDASSVIFQRVPLFQQKKGRKEVSEGSPSFLHLPFFLSSVNDG